MSHTANTVRALHVISGVLAVAVFLWSIGFPAFLRPVEAASLTFVSDTLSDSDVSVVSNHTISFTTPNGLLTGQAFTITFPAGFDLTNIVIGDVDLATSSTDQTLAGAAGADTWGYSKSGQVLIFETPTNYGVPSSTPITVEIGTNATFGASGANRIINPTAGFYEITIGGSMQDSGATRVAILDNVQVTASVATLFEFSVAGVNNGSTVNGTSTTGTTTPTTIAFGALTPQVIKTMAQDLTVTTNAKNGFAVTVYQDAPGFVSSTGADIDGFIDGAYDDTPQTWVDPGTGPTDENTWGHWGMTSDDPGLFGSNLWVSPSTTPRTMFSHNNVVNASTTRVGYQVEISSLQEAGNDYSATLTYVATPTF